MSAAMVLPKCPKCGAGELMVYDDHSASCPSCLWGGMMLVFSPLPLRGDEAKEALPEDATCVNHPTKQAVAQCEGTGDYICSLCSVTVDDRIYSAQYLESEAGKDATKNAFGRYLDRPDRAIAALGLCSLLLFFIVPLTLPVAWYYYFRASKLRKTNEIYAKIQGRVSLFITWIGLLLLSLLCSGIFIYWITKIL